MRIKLNKPVTIRGATYTSGIYDVVGEDERGIKDRDAARIIERGDGEEVK